MTGTEGGGGQSKGGKSSSGKGGDDSSALSFRSDGVPLRTLTQKMTA